MITMINWLEHWLQGDNTKILYILALILIANMIDFLLGWVNAKFNKRVPFSSSKAIYGIARKMILFIVLVFFIPVAMLVPYPVGIGALYVLFLGYLLSEINSILSHLRLTEDEKKSELFADFVQRIFNQNNKGGN